MPFDTKEARVKLTSGRSIRIPVLGGTTTNELCQKVAEEEKAPAETITLKFDGKVLKRCRGMSHYGIREDMELKVQIIPKETLKLHLHLSGTPQEIISIEINNTSCNEEIKTKFMAAKPCHTDKYTTFSIGDMELKMESYAYEDCIKDGDNIKVKFPYEDAAREREEREENERQEAANNLSFSIISQRKVDIVFSFDTTGSMYSLLATVKEHLRESVTKLMSDIPNIQIGLIAHGDYCDEDLYVLRKHDITSDMAKLVKFVEETKGSGGEGSFACYEWVLRKANGLSWREDAAKALVIIGDVVPHPTSYTNLKINWREELDKLCEKGVKVYGVQAKYNTHANSFYGYMARKSGGAHIKFQHISLITDMFLAVCYRESGDDQLQAYVDEVKNEGRMTEEIMDVMKQLEKKPEEEEEDKEEEKRTEEAAKETNEAEKETEEAEESTGGAEAVQPSSPKPQEEEYVPAAWWDATKDQSNGPTFNYIYSMNYWHRNGAYRIYNLPAAIRKSIRFKTLTRGLITPQ